METKDPSEGYVADIHPARSILDQVDDYLNEKHGTQEKVEWQSMQVDLDRLSHTLFENKLSIQQQEQQSQVQKQQQYQQQHVRPDMVFSPMGSPMVVPNNPSSISANATPFLDASVGSNSTADTPFLGANSNGFKTKKTNKNNNGQFSPLTSPALLASDQQQALNFALPESGLSKRTPSSTCLRGKRVSASGSSSKVVKNSPNLTARRRYSTDYLKNTNNNNSWDDLIFKLPENGAPYHHHNPSPEGIAVPSSPESKMTPASLMNYPKVILPSNVPRSSGSDKSQSPDEKMELDRTNSNNDYNDDIVTNTSTLTAANNNNDINHSANGKIWRATESPVIKPRHNVSQPRSQVRTPQLPPTTSSSNPHSAVVPESVKQESLHRVRSKNSRSSSLSLGANGHGDASPTEEDEYSKREVHKVAEQGRRNRLNVALTELNSLLPSDLKDTVTIPSKATTVELACSYIKQLRGEKQENH